MRRVVQALYWLMTIGLAAPVALSATWGAYVRPRVPPSAVVTADVTPDSPAGRTCGLALKASHGALVERAGRTFFRDGGPSPDMLRDWATWSATWRDELHEQRISCRLGDVPAMEPLSRLADHLERLNLAYTTALNGFSDVGRRQLVEAGRLFEELGLDREVATPRP